MKDRYSKILEKMYKKRILNKLEVINESYPINIGESEQIIFEVYKIGYEGDNINQTLYLSNKTLKMIKFLNKSERDNIYNSIKERMIEIIKSKGMRELREFKIVLYQCWEGNIIFKDGEIFEERF